MRRRIPTAEKGISKRLQISWVSARDGKSQAQSAACLMKSLRGTCHETTGRLSQVLNEPGRSKHALSGAPSQHALTFVF